MHKVLIIDDEALARQLIRSLLAPHSDYEVLAECGDGFEGFKAIQEHAPDLIFLDVQMPRISGFEMLELLDKPPAVIFTTAFDEYAMKAFDAAAVDYLLKPITRERFETALRKWQQQAVKPEPEALADLSAAAAGEGYQHRIVVKDNGIIRIIPAADIHYIEAADDYIKIFTPAGYFLKKATLGHLAQSLDPAQFVRVHRSYLIPVAQLQRIDPYEKDSHLARLHCGAQVAVSKSGMAKLKEVLGW